MAKKKTKSSVVLTARDILNGYVANKDNMQSIWNLTPIQFMDEEEKTEDWVKWNMDFLERVGFYQISNKWDKVTKNYKLANGEIEMSDYVALPDNEYSSMLGIITTDHINDQFPLHFYPLVPNIVNTFTGEFAKRDTSIYAEAIDEYSKQEQFEYKLGLVKDILVKDFVTKKQQDLMMQGLDLTSNDKKIQQQINQEMETAKKLAEAEVQFKSYRGIAAQWANHMINYNNNRFNLHMLEEVNFRNALITDSEFWHVRLKEDDVKVELWNPKYVFYHKSPDVWWTSEGNYIGRQLYMTAPDIINLYGDLLTIEDVEKLRAFSTTVGFGGVPYVTAGFAGDTSWYNDYSQPYPKGQRNATTERYLQERELSMYQSASFSLNDVMGSSTALYNTLYGNPIYLRVTEGYWVSQRKVGELTIMKEGQIVTKEIVDSFYEPKVEPIYDKSLQKKETIDNLIEGEHVDWIWINEVRHGIKIGSNRVVPLLGTNTDFEPIYLDGDRIPFEFKAQGNKFGAKLPVEGRILSEYNATSMSLVDRLKGFQVGYNVVNNQMMELLADNVGKVLMVDQNTIPKSSMDGSWGKHNFPKFYEVMKDFKLALIDPTSANTGGVPSGFSHFQVADMSNTDRILMNVKLSEYFREAAFETVGVSRQRMGSILASESATGVEQSINNSYSQTEWYFEQHMNHLMPRVHQMILEAQQYLCATNPLVQINYQNTQEENVFFQIEGYKALLSDLHVYSKSTANVRNVMQKLQSLALQNNTAGATLSDLMSVVTAKSPSEIIEKIRKAEQQRTDQAQQQQQQQQEMQKQQQEFLQKQKEMELQHDDMWKQKQMDNDVLIAQIRASVMNTGDINENKNPDNFDYMDKLTSENQFNTEHNFKERQHNDNINVENKKLMMKERELQSREKIAQKQLDVAKANKNKYDKKK